MRPHTLFIKRRRCTYCIHIPGHVPVEGAHTTLRSPPPSGGWFRPPLLPPPAPDIPGTYARPVIRPCWTRCTRWWWPRGRCWWLSTCRPPAAAAPAAYAVVRGLTVAAAASALEPVPAALTGTCTGVHKQDRVTARQRRKPRRCRHARRCPRRCTLWTWHGSRQVGLRAVRLLLCRPGPLRNQRAAQVLALRAKRASRYPPLTTIACPTHTWPTRTCTRSGGGFAACGAPSTPPSWRWTSSGCRTPRTRMTPCASTPCSLRWCR